MVRRYTDVYTGIILYKNKQIYFYIKKKKHFVINVFYVLLIEKNQEHTQKKKQYIIPYTLKAIFVLFQRHSLLTRQLLFQSQLM